MLVYLLVLHIENPPLYFAKKIKNANEAQLLRLLVSRSEVSNIVRGGTGSTALICTYWQINKEKPEQSDSQLLVKDLTRKIKLRNVVPIHHIKNENR